MNPIYLDYAATTPVDPRVLEAMLPFFSEHFGNAASRNHSKGHYAKEAVENAREEVAQTLGADPREIIWTSGATESNNLALKGVAASSYYKARGNHMVTVTTEHKAVLDPCEALEEHGIDVTYLTVDSQGSLDLERLEEAITEKTILVSVMHANNETGVLHPIRDIGRICKERNVVFHTDATQSFGKEPIDVQEYGIDLLSLSAHKVYGPKGTGALYVRRKRPRVRCEALIHGGGHERGLRSGTLNVPGIVGLGTAARFAREERAEEQKQIRSLRDLLQQGLVAKLDVTVNGHPEQRMANMLNVSFAGLDADSLMERTPGVALSASAACTSASMQPSYVLAALGYDEERIAGSIRFSLGRFTTQSEIESTIEQVIHSARALGK
jgi:cysteine desulfurase